MDKKCNDTGCGVKELCARFTAEDKPQQQYYTITPRWNNECNMFFSTAAETPKEMAERRGEETRELYKDMN